jgi:hypothetical protein
MTLIRHPIQLVPAPLAVALFIASVGAFLFLATKTIDRRLRIEGAPLGIVSLELAGTSERTRFIMDAWGPELQDRARTVQRWDYPFIIAYTLVLAFAVAGVGVILRDQRFIAELSGIFAWAAVAAGVLDVVENLALTRVLNSETSQPWPRIAQIAAGGKFVLLFAIAAFLILGLFAGVAAVIAQKSAVTKG